MRKLTCSPVLDWSEAEIGKFYRPRKQPVTIRSDADVIAWLKADGPGYQTKANGLLLHAMIHFSKEKTPARRAIKIGGAGTTNRQK